MAGIFSYESRFSQVIMKVAYGCYLNLLWLVCSLPIFTIGAATVALYTITLKIAADEEGEILITFLRAFRDNFKQATIVWLIILATAGVLGVDIYVLRQLSQASAGPLAIILTLALAIVIVACIALVIVHMYVFPLIAYVENSTWEMLKNSLFIGLRYLFCTVLVFAIHAAMAFAVIAIFTPLAILGVGFCAVLSSMLILPVLRAVTTPPADEEAEVEELLP